MFEQESLQNESMEKYIWNQPLEHPKMVSTKWENTSPFFGQNPARHKMMVYAGHVPTHFMPEISRGIFKSTTKLKGNFGRISVPLPFSHVFSAVVIKIGLKWKAGNYLPKMVKKIKTQLTVPPSCWTPLLSPSVLDLHPSRRARVALQVPRHGALAWQAWGLI